MSRSNALAMPSHALLRNQLSAPSTVYSLVTDQPSTNSSQERLAPKGALPPGTPALAARQRGRPLKKRRPAPASPAWSRFRASSVKASPSILTRSLATLRLRLAVLHLTRLSSSAITSHRSVSGASRERSEEKVSPDRAPGLWASGLAGLGVSA